MSTLSTSVQVLTKNKPYYLKTNLGLMKIRGELLSAAQRNRFEFENLKKFGKIFEKRRKRRIPKYNRNIPRCIDIFRASFGTQQYSKIRV